MAPGKAVNRFPFQDLPKDKLVSTSFEVSLKDASNPAFNVKIDTSALYGSLDQFAIVMAEHEEHTHNLGKDLRQAFVGFGKDLEEVRTELDATRRTQDQLVKNQKAQKGWQTQLRDEIMDEMRSMVEKTRVATISEAKEALDETTLVLQRRLTAMDTAVADLTGLVNSLRTQLDAPAPPVEQAPCIQGICPNELEASLASLRTEVQSKLDARCAELLVGMSQTAAQAAQTVMDASVAPQLAGLWDGVNKQNQHSDRLRVAVERTRNGAITMAACALLPSARALLVPAFKSWTSATRPRHAARRLVAALSATSSRHCKREGFRMLEERKRRHNAAAALLKAAAMVAQSAHRRAISSTLQRWHRSTAVKQDRPGWEEAIAEARQYAQKECNEVRREAKESCAALAWRLELTTSIVNADVERVNQSHQALKSGVRGALGMLSKGFSLGLLSLRSFIVRQGTGCLSCGGGGNNELLSAEFARHLLQRAVADLSSFLEAPVHEGDEDIWDAGSERPQPSMDRRDSEPSIADPEENHRNHGFKPGTRRPPSNAASTKSLDETMSKSMGPSGELRLDAEGMHMDSRGSPVTWARPRRNSKSDASAPQRPPRPESAPSGGRQGQVAGGTYEQLPVQRSHASSQIPRSNVAIGKAMRPQSAGVFRGRAKRSS